MSNPPGSEEVLNKHCNGEQFEWSKCKTKLQAKCCKVIWEDWLGTLCGLYCIRIYSNKLKLKVHKPLCFKNMYDLSMEVLESVYMCKYDLLIEHCKSSYCNRMFIKLLMIKVSIINNTYFHQFHSLCTVL